MSFSVGVDPANPGQFFACCGLLELADRLWSGAEARFDGAQFEVSGEAALRPLLEALVAEPAVEVTRLPGGVEVKPLLAPLELRLPGDRPPLRLDAWMRLGVEGGAAAALARPPWNFWSGQQTSMRIWTPLREALRAQLARGRLDDGSRLFAETMALSGRFGFDPGPAWNARDVGFSPNEQRVAVASSPAVELLAAVGLQRFRPRLGPGSDTFLYGTWTLPLGPLPASAAAAGALRQPGSTLYRGRVVSRGNYAGLDRSTPLEGNPP